MEDSFTKSRYFRYIIDNNAIFDEERKSFNLDIGSFLGSNSSDLGSLLKYHLTIEYYIDEYLSAAYPTITNYRSARLTFIQKLELLYAESTPTAFYYSALRNLNSIRNRFSHNIHYQLSTEDFKDIQRVMHAWYIALEKPLLSDMELIADFTVWICAHLHFTTTAIKKISPSLGLPGYLEWLSSMMQAIYSNDV